MEKIDSSMESYKGREIELYQMVCRRYALDPAKTYVKDDNWAPFE